MNKKDRFQNLHLVSIIFVCRHDYAISPEIISQKINVDKTTAETMINQLVEKN